MKTMGMRWITCLATALLSVAAASAGGAQEPFGEPTREPAPPMASAPTAGEPTAPIPEAWLQEDPGAERYQSAREELAAGRYMAAAEGFEMLRRVHPRSAYVPDSYYWQAFALFREGGARHLREAAELLALQGRDHPGARTRQDAEALQVRVEAQLARRGDADAAAAITRQAVGPCGEGQEVRLAALSALLNMNADRAAPILRDVLRNRDECSVELRRRAVFLVAQTMDDASVDILLDLAHRNPDPDREVREQAIFWLHQVEAPEAMAALESILLESDDPEMQERALFAIGQRGDDATPVLRSFAERSDVDAELRADAIFWMGQGGGTDGAAGIMELYPGLDDPELKDRALFAVAQAGSEDARAWLLERMRDPTESMELRRQALFWAGQMGSVGTEELRAIYGSIDDAEVREHVIFVAAQQGTEASVDFLMEVAADETDADLRERAIFWLGQSDDPRVTDFLLGLVSG